MLKPTTFFVFVISVIFAFRSFEQMCVMTRGGPVGATATLVYYIFDKAFKFGKLIVPSLANAFGIFMFAQFFKTIPYELEEAAYLDGASRWTVLWKIMVPLSRPAIATLFMFVFITEWNDLFKPLVFTSTRNMRTVQLGLTVFQEQFKVDYSLLMAAVVFVTIPSIALFFIGQKQFIKGVASSGFK